eukprot:s1402_g8.t1
MSRLEDLWDTLRRAGVESAAPILIRHGVTSVSQVAANAETLLGSGLPQWQIEAILASCPTTVGSLEKSTDFTREDLPVRSFHKRASLQAALEAAQPNQRQKSLRLLDQDVLARSTNPAYEARIRTYMAIATAWEMPAFPLDSSNIRCFAASLKAGGYRSAAAYFQAICSYQQRNLRTHVPQMVRATIRDCLRSILRGLGTSKLKDSFDALLLGRIEAVDDNVPFSFGLLHHIRDMAILGLWYMMRESELAGARAGDLSLDSNQVSMTIPVHKTDPRGRFTQRTLTCSCSSRVHGMCVWHSAERHLVRLELHPCRSGSQSFPLFPDQEGRTASKQMFIEAFRKLIAQTGTATTRVGPDGQESQRFAGHVLRIAGAQMMSASGVELSLIQLLGRWTSTAVLRYTQDSALVRVPQIPRQVLSQDGGQPQRVQLSMAPQTPAPVQQDEQTTSATRSARPKAFASAVRSLQAEMEQIKGALSAPPETFVFRPKARILHRASRYEANNEPAKWRTPCGWNYGSRTFLRTASEDDGTRKCKKCFDLSDHSSSDSSDSSSELSDLEVTSASSADDA